MSFWLELKLLITYWGNILWVGMFCCNFTLAKKRQKNDVLAAKEVRTIDLPAYVAALYLVLYT